jgi:hypothetical protein
MRGTVSGKKQHQRQRRVLPLQNFGQLERQQGAHAVTEQDERFIGIQLDLVGENLSQRQDIGMRRFTEAIFSSGQLYRANLNSGRQRSSPRSEDRSAASGKR